jgi:hypothetical protein
MGIDGYPICLEKQRRIDDLVEKVKRMEAKVRYQECRTKEGYFVSSTRSSMIPMKAKREQKEKKPKGARLIPIRCDVSQVVGLWVS